MVSEKRILIAVLVSLVVLIIMVSMGFNAILFFKYIELKGIVEGMRRENIQLKFNRGEYIDLKTTIEEQRKEIIRLEERNNLCLEKLNKTIDGLEKCVRGGGLNENKLNEKDLLD
jgi:hypothetical protein